jgi:hypothetical protein
MLGIPESQAAKLRHPRRKVCQDREITHGVAIRWLLDNSIPSQMWEDFAPQLPADAGRSAVFEGLNHLEDKVYQASGVLFLVANELGRELEDTWDDKGGEAAGIVKLGLDTAEALKQAFKESHAAWRNLTHPGEKDAA